MKSSLKYLFLSVWLLFASMCFADNPVTNINGLSEVDFVTLDVALGGADSGLSKPTSLNTLNEADDTTTKSYKTYQFVKLVYHYHKLDRWRMNNLTVPVSVETVYLQPKPT